MSKLPSPGGASGKNGMRTRNAVMVAFTLPVFLLYIFFFIVVMFLGVYYSMTNWTGISQTFDFIGLRNYATVLSDERFWQAIWFNIRYAIMLDIGVILISLLIALALNNLKGKTSTLFRSIFFIPAVLSLVTVGLIWNELFLRAFPPIGEALGIEWLSKSILGSPATAIFGILIVNLWQGCATPTVLLLAGLQSVPSDLYEAATIDGANAWQKFKNITVPFLIPIITILSIQIPTIFSGAMLTETIFVWPGIGRLSYTAILDRDYPLIMALLLTTVIILACNLVADILYALVDPRIRYE